MKKEKSHWNQIKSRESIWITDWTLFIGWCYIFRIFWFPRQHIFCNHPACVPQLADWAHWLSYKDCTAALDGKGMCQTSAGSALGLASAMCRSLQKYLVGQNGKEAMRERHHKGVVMKSHIVFSATKVKPRHINYDNAFGFEIICLLDFWLSTERVF